MQIINFAEAKQARAAIVAPVPAHKPSRPLHLFFGSLGDGEFGLYGCTPEGVKTLAAQREPYTPSQRAGGPERPRVSNGPNGGPVVPAGYKRGLEVQQRRANFQVVQ